MKKYLIIFLFICSCFISCLPNENKTQDITTHDKIPWTSVTKFEFEGHEYIKFKEGEAYQGFAGAVHNPECKCFKDSIN